MLFGKRPARVLGVEPFLVHDQRNLRLLLALEGMEESPLEAVLADLSVRGDVRRGGRVEVSLVAGQVVEVRALPDETPASEA